LWRHSAIIIFFDEAGGYYDSGYVQPIDFFGDGPRVPLIVVSPFAKPGYVDHSYADRASILKFIEYDWRLRPPSSRSRDNLPNPTVSPNDPYVPTNSPAIRDLRTLFNF
jgi:phospholipase C